MSVQNLETIGAVIIAGDCGINWQKQADHDTSMCKISVKFPSVKSVVTISNQGICIWFSSTAAGITCSCWNDVAKERYWSHVIV